MACSILEITYSKFISDADGNLIRAVLLCDTAAELPGINDFSGYTLIQGSTCHVIADNQDYMLDSGGSWHPYGGEMWQNVYSKSETDTLLNGKQGLLDAAQLAAVNSGITAAKLTADEAALAEVVDNGAKNMLQFDAISRTSLNGVDFTYNADGSVTVNTASSASDNAYCYLNLDGSNVDVKALCDGNHVIAGCPTNSGDVTLRIMGTGYTTVTDSGNGATMTTYSGENVIRVAVYVAKNGTPSNIKVKPMICTKAAWDASHEYQLYAPTNRELYEMILAL